VKIVNTGKLTKKLIIGKDIELTAGAAEALRANGSTIEE
jgi:ribosomal protein L15